MKDVEIAATKSDGLSTVAKALERDWLENAGRSDLLPLCSPGKER